jgi:glycosyltransferase involved in cell wall biosynthesis
MAVTPGRVLVVTQDGALSGDQLFLLYVLRWLRAVTDVQTDVLSWQEGPLTDDLRDVTGVRVVAELDRWRPARVFEVLRLRRVTQLLKSARLRWWLHRRRGVDVLYVNGLPAARIVGFLGRTHPPVVVHVHDQGELDDARLGPDDRAAVLARTRRFVAASDEIARRLVDDWRVPADRIARHDHFLAGADHLPASTRRPGRADLGLQEAEIVIGGIGTADWWAAADQFVLVAWALRRARPDLPLRFLWIAGDDDPRVLWPLHHDLANAGLADVTVVARGRRPLDYVAVMDVLVLATRVGAQELIALEAAAAGVPVVATDNLAENATIAELAEVTPYLDTDALVSAILSLVDDPGRRTERIDLGLAVASRRHDVSVGGPALLEVLTP